MIAAWLDGWLPAPARRWIVAMLLALAAIAGAVWWAMRPAPVAEPPAPEQHQADGSLILERRPDPAAQPKQQIPRRAKVERIASVTVQPDAAPPEDGQPCPPVTVDLSLIREPDGGRRVIASSPDGRVVGGLDVPVELVPVPPLSRKWATGLSWEPVHRTYGVWIERDVEVPFVNLAARLGIDVNQTRMDTSATGMEGRVRIGIAF